MQKALNNNELSSLARQLSMLLHSGISVLESVSILREDAVSSDGKEILGGLYERLEETGEFVINLTTEKLAYATDYCGVRSGRDVDKFKELHLTPEKAEHVSAPLIGESPVNIECRVVKKETPGSHHIFLAEVKAVHVDDAYMDQKGRFALEKTDPIVYVHGQYYSLGKLLGTFGYSVKKPAKKTVKKNVKKKKK